MAPSSERHRHRHGSVNPIPTFLSLLNPKPLPLPLPSQTTPFPPATTTPRVLLPLPLANSSSATSPPSSVSVGAGIGRLSLDGKGGEGPAFIGQVFSMCDLTGTGLMAVSSHFDIPFLSKRTPEWMKKMMKTVVKSDNGPVFRFFMDLGDAVAYVKQLNIPSGIVGACRLDLAYKNFKEKPHLFKFVPNEKQVKLANKLLKRIPGADGRQKIDGVPVFSAQNLDIAIATADGIKWYTPYFFEKSILDNILEESSDQHFHALIQTRHLQRRGDVVDDDSLPPEVTEETGDNMWDSAEVQELLDEVGYPEIPFSVIKKAAAVQLWYAVDKLLLGNKWLRKATGIQPQFPYMVDSFEERSAASLLRTSELSKSITDSEMGTCTESPLSQQHDFRFSYGDWSKLPWSNQKTQRENGGHMRNIGLPKVCKKKEMQLSPLLPNVTMVGISATGPGQMSKATIKKTMEELTEELEHDAQGSAVTSGSSSKPNHEDRDPLFVANVGDYYSGIAKTSSSRWVLGGNK